MSKRNYYTTSDVCRMSGLEKSKFLNWANTYGLHTANIQHGARTYRQYNNEALETIALMAGIHGAGIEPSRALGLAKMVRNQLGAYLHQGWTHPAEAVYLVLTGKGEYVLNFAAAVRIMLSQGEPNEPVALVLDIRSMLESFHAERERIDKEGEAA